MNHDVNFIHNELLSITQFSVCIAVLEVASLQYGTTYYE